MSCKSKGDDCDKEKHHKKENECGDEPSVWWTYTKNPGETHDLINAYTPQQTKQADKPTNKNFQDSALLKFPNPKFTEF